MTKKASPDKRPQIHATVDPDIAQRIKAEAGERFESDSTIINERLRLGYDAGPAPKTAFADTKERSAAIDLEMKETRLAQIRKEVLTVDAAIEVVEEVMAGMRTEGLQLMADFASEFNLDAKELERRYLAAMAGPGARAVEREPLEMLADEFSREPLP